MKHPAFDETWFRLLCGLSVQALLGPWEHHVKYLRTLTPRITSRRRNEKLSDVLDETIPFLDGGAEGPIRLDSPPQVPH